MDNPVYDGDSTDVYVRMLEQIKKSGIVIER